MDELENSKPKVAPETIAMVVLIIVTLVLVIGMIVHSARNASGQMCTLTQAGALKGSTSSKAKEVLLPVTMMRKFPQYENIGYEYKSRGRTRRRYSISPANERVAMAFDDKDKTKYLNFFGVGSGIEFATKSLSKITKIQLTSANDAPHRDPTAYKLYGYIQGGYTELSAGRIKKFPKTRFQSISVKVEDQKQPCDHYLLKFTDLRGPDKSIMQIADVKFYGYDELISPQCPKCPQSSDLAPKKCPREFLAPTECSMRLSFNKLVSLIFNMHWVNTTIQDPRKPDAPKESLGILLKKVVDSGYKDEVRSLIENYRYYLDGSVASTYDIYANLIPQIKEQSGIKNAKNGVQRKNFLLDLKLLDGFNMFEDTPENFIQWIFRVFVRLFVQMVKNEGFVSATVKGGKEREWAAVRVANLEVMMDPFEQDIYRTNLSACLSGLGKLPVTQNTWLSLIIANTEAGKLFTKYWNETYT